MTTTAYFQLENHQRQLDEGGEQVGVSRQALDEVLAKFVEMERLLTLARSQLGLPYWEQSDLDPLNDKIDALLGLIQFEVTFISDGCDFEEIFRCWAEDLEHAHEQCLNANPEATIRP
jgi:hypothetical protein